MKKIKLYPSQKSDIKRLVKEPSRGGLVASCTGAGKTVVGVGLIKNVGAAVALIVGPVNTEDGWRKTVKTMTGADMRVLGNYAPVNIHWTREIAKGTPGVYFVGWEWLATQAVYDHWPVDLVVFDEIHRASTRDTRSADMAYHLGGQVAKRGGYRLGLSATPNGNNMRGFWSVAHALWPTKDFDWEFNSFWRWARRHLVIEDVYVGNDETREVPGREIVQGSVVKELPLYIRHEERVRCCKFHPNGIQADLPERVVHMVGVDLSATQKRLYRELEEDFIAYVEENDLPIETEWPMVLNLRLHQICLAVPTTELATRLRKNEWDENELELYTKVSYPLNVKSTAVDALMDILADIPTDEKVIVWTSSQGVIEAVVARVNKKFGGRNNKPAAAWDGTIKKRDRQALKERFTGGTDVRIMVCQIASMAEGTDGLQDVCHNEVWLQMSAHGVLNKQAAGRLMRNGQEHVVNSWRIFARGTRQEEMMEKLDDNQEYLGKALRAK